MQGNWNPLWWKKLKSFKELYEIKFISFFKMKEGKKSAHHSTFYYIFVTKVKEKFSFLYKQVSQSRLTFWGKNTSKGTFLFKVHIIQISKDDIPKIIKEIKKFSFHFWSYQDDIWDLYDSVYMVDMLPKLFWMTPQSLIA